MANQNLKTIFSVKEPISRIGIFLFPNSIIRFILLSLLFGGISILISIYENLFFSREGIIAYTDDFSTLLDFVFLNPLVIVLLHNYFKKFGVTFQELLEQNRIDLESKEIQNNLNFYIKYFKSPVPFLASIATTGIAMFLHVKNIHLYDGYFIFQGQNFMSLTGWFIIVLTSSYVYFLVYCVQQIFLLIRLKRKVFKNRVQLDILHEDRCAGLKKIGDLCLTLNYSLFLLAITVLLFLLTDLWVFGDPLSFRVLFIMPIYFIGGTFLFFFPLWPIHLKMLQERSMKLNTISGIFEDLFKKLQSNKGTSEQANIIDQLKNVQELFTRLEKTPKWPIDTRTYSKFFATILIPLVVFTGQLISSFEDLSTLILAIIDKF